MKQTVPAPTTSIATGHPRPARQWLHALLLVAALLPALPASAQPSLARVGDPAPAFTLKAIDGRTVSLSDFRGKYVVLEWWNSECHAINTHYGAGAMPAAQRRARSDGTVWLSIDFTHPAHSRHVDAKRTAGMLRQWKTAQHAMLQDPSGSTGRACGALVTPHTYVIDPGGTLIYAGAIDDQQQIRDVRKANNLALAAIQESPAGKPVSRPLTQAYG